MRRLIAIAALLAVAGTLPAAAQSKVKENPKCTPNPVFEKFPNSVYHSCERSRFSKLKLYQAKDPAKIGGPYDEFEKEGEYWYYFDYVAPDANGTVPSRLELFRNYENALKAAGGTMLYADGDRSFTYTLKRPSGEYWGLVGCGAGTPAKCDRIQHKIIRVAAMEQSVVVSADQIRKSIAESGKVVFYGIYFDTDKAVVKPESKPTLEEMAKFLKANAGTRVFVVGHTDGQGALDRNQKLSRERAAAVVAALAADHGIPRERMTAEGVGPLAPVAANDAEAGRAKNRRVEMVLR
ncbi:MAG TPA: OmpA family protein [Usitatibacter sp.]|nr:OmpA family protein [Usitatibacter sp.]